MDYLIEWLIEFAVSSPQGLLLFMGGLLLLLAGLSIFVSWGMQPRVKRLTLIAEGTQAAADLERAAMARATMRVFGLWIPLGVVLLLVLGAWLILGAGNG